MLGSHIAGRYRRPCRLSTDGDNPVPQLSVKDNIDPGRFHRLLPGEDIRHYGQQKEREEGPKKPAAVARLHEIKSRTTPNYLMIAMADVLLRRGRRLYDAASQALGWDMYPELLVVYGQAKEMVLREPILAKKVSAFGRAWRWSKVKGLFWLLSRIPT